MTSRTRTPTVTARHIMHKPVVTAEPDMTVQTVMQLLLDHRISGAPVIDERNRVIGVISQSDLLRYQRRAGPSPQPSFYYEADGEALVGRMQADVPASTRVRDIMTPAAFMTEEQTPVREIARFMLRRRIHRVIVTRRGRLAGIVTSMDLLRVLSKSRAPELHDACHSARRRKGVT